MKAILKVINNMAKVNPDYSFIDSGISKHFLLFKHLFKIFKEISKLIKITITKGTIYETIIKSNIINIMVNNNRVYKAILNNEILYQSLKQINDLYYYGV